MNGVCRTAKLLVVTVSTPQHTCKAGDKHAFCESNVMARPARTEPAKLRNKLSSKLTVECKCEQMREDKFGMTGHEETVLFGKTRHL